MKYYNYFLDFFILFLLASILGSCSNTASTEPINKYSSQNYILNYSFEREKVSSLENWQVLNQDNIEFKADHPENGGRWSLQLYPSASLTQVIIPVPNENIYELSIWSKTGLDRSNYPEAGGFGWLQLSYKYDDSVFISKKIQMDETANWQRYTIIDTVQSEQCDSIIVSFGFTPNDYMGYGVYFDLCSFYTIK